MSYPRTIVLTVVGLIALAGLSIGCGDGESKGQTGGLVDEIVDSLAVAVQENLVDAEFAAEVMIPEDEPEASPAVLLSQMNELQILNDQAYVLSAGGLVVFDFESRGQETIESAETLNALVVHEGNVYVGGEHLYKIVDGVLEAVEEEFDSEIIALYSYEYRLMVGTRCNLYSTGILGKELLLEDVTVTSMAADETGLWVGTDGQGLYRWDQERFRKRYLIRDETLFDTVNAIDYKHQHVYVGTTNGLHVFDGGRWKTVTTEWGLPSNNVLSIDASAWVVYAGTDAGVVSFFNDEVTSVKGLESTVANSLRHRGNSLVVATDFDGLLRRTGDRITTLVSPVTEINRELLTSAF